MDHSCWCVHAGPHPGLSLYHDDHLHLCRSEVVFHPCMHDHHLSFVLLCLCDTCSFVDYIICNMPSLSLDTSSLLLTLYGINDGIIMFQVSGPSLKCVIEKRHLWYTLMHVVYKAASTYTLLHLCAFRPPWCMWVCYGVCFPTLSHKWHDVYHYASFDTDKM